MTDSGGSDTGGEPAAPGFEPLTGMAPEPLTAPGPGPDGPPPIPAPVPMDPLVDLPQRGGRLLSASFDVLTTGRADLRRASLWIGLLLLITVGPLALLVLGLTIHGISAYDLVEAGGPTIGPGVPADAVNQISFAFLATVFLALAGYIVVVVEGQTIAIVLLAGRLAGRPMPLRVALMRSRAVFWRVVGGALVVGIPLEIVQLIVQLPLTSGLAHPSQGVSLLATVVATAVGWPFVYLVSGIVLGAVAPMEAVRRSMTLARARPLTALAISIFAALAQYLIVFGIGAADDLVERVVTTLGLNTNGGTLTLGAAGLLALVLVVAFGTLQFTVTAITIAPQVVAFLALTRYTGGLDLAIAADARRTARFVDPPAPGTTRPRFRWLQWRVVVASALGGFVSLAALARLASI